MAYFHVDIGSCQRSKKAGTPCGDVFLVRRTPFHTTVILADGIGSGIKAHIAARMNVSRLAELLNGGVSLRDAFMSVAGTISNWGDHSMPFAAFLLMRVMNDGTATVLSYEMPPPVLVSRRGVRVAAGEALVVPAGIASEGHFHLHPSEGVVLVSDGIVQAGLGRGFQGGWGTQGLETFLTNWIGRGQDIIRLAEDIMVMACYHDGPRDGDDKTVLLAHSRIGVVVNVLTGPPGDRTRDAEVAGAFFSADGCRVLCGGTTAEIAARYSGASLELEQRPVSYSTPPRYFLEGVDLVTEGAVTLTQVLNIIDEQEVAARDRSSAADLAALLQNADFVRFTVGLARNPANADIVYLKQGILGRDKIVPLLAGKLERMGKLVTVNYV